MDSIKITKLSVLQSRIVIYLHCNQDNKYSNPQLIQSLLSNFPNLTFHKCKNSVSNNFIDVMYSTSIPHVLEHLIIDSQISALPKESPKIDIFGFSEWVDEGQGIAKIEVSYFDDLVALRSLNNCIEILNKLIIEM